MKKKLLNLSLKRSIFIDLIEKLRPGHHVTIFMLVRSTGRRMKIISQTGSIVNVKKHRTSAYVNVKKSIFGYRFNTLIRLNSLNLVRFFIY